MCKVLKDYGTVAEKGSKALKLQTITNINKQKRLALVSYKDGMSVNITDITIEAKKLKELLEGYLDYKTPVREVKANRDIIRSLTTLPSGDVNYQTTLRDATKEDLEEAVKQMQTGGRNATRIKACEADLKRRNGANSKPQKTSNNTIQKVEEKKREAKVIPFPTEDKKPNIITLKTEGKHTYGECVAKMLKETKELQDADNQYVITGLLELLKVDGDFRNNFMREDKSYDGFHGYMFEAVMNGYCGSRDGVAWLDKDSALGLAIDYYNADSEAMKAEKEKKLAEEKAKREAEANKKKGWKKNGKNVRKKKGRTAS